MLQLETRLYLILLVFVVPVNTALAGSLQNHPSPYLRLHATDPINWHTWGSDVLKQAQVENKLIYLSIGYFSCHWCHVMQKESYSNPQIGQLLNKNFIAVKVDRELRPELDRRMMRFVESVRGTAGWPLNVFLTPQGYPVTGFTYLPREDFSRVLQQLSQKWAQSHTEIGAQAQNYFNQTELNSSNTDLVQLPNQHFDKVVDAFVAQAMGIADELQGGFGETSKFPSYPQMKALMDSLIDSDARDAEVAAFIRLTLDSMAKRNMMDQVNYGFFRYTTDPDWRTPHYEKMLYDNAQQVLLYLQAEEVWPGQGYADTAINTIDFMNRFLWHPSGAYQASLSAVDVNNMEGEAYLWTQLQLQQVLTKAELSALQQSGLFAVANQSKFPIPHISETQIKAELKQSILNKLRQARRSEMPLDHKRLSSWNALALLALLKAEAYQPDKSISNRIQKLYQFITREFVRDGRVIRFAGQSNAAENTLEDYAYIIHALALYAQNKKHKQAADLAEQLLQHTFDTYYKNQRWVQDPDSLIPGDPGGYVLQDGVLESPVTALLQGMLMLPELDDRLKSLGDELIGRLTRDMLDIPYHYASAIMLQKQFLSAKDAVKPVANIKNNKP